MDTLYNIGAITVFCLISLLFVGFLVWLFVFAGLSDEQRYGIDEHGNAKTPEYMQKKKQREDFERSL